MCESEKRTKKTNNEGKVMKDLCGPRVSPEELNNWAKERLGPYAHRK